jgi:hypothetical protein
MLPFMTGSRLAGRVVPFLSATALGIASVASPSAHADVVYGTGSYSVPRQLPYGVYTARADEGLYSVGCTFSTWSRDGKLISSDATSGGESRTANISAPAVATFITHGCTPWITVG